MADYRRHLLPAGSNTGYQRFDESDSDEEGEQYEYALGPQPYIPPIAEDPELPGDYAAEVAAAGEGAIRDTGDPPMKRPHVDYPGFANYAYGHNNINFHDGAVNRDLEVPDIDWDQFEYGTNLNLRTFFNDNITVPIPANVFPLLVGPFDGFNCRMSTAEVNINQRDFLFDGVRPIVPDIGYAAGLMGMWLKRHIETLHPERGYSQYKAMLCMHCVFVKYFAHGGGDPEYRRFLFDKMCERDDGRIIHARTPAMLFKMLYNTTVKMAYDKLEMRNCENVPNVDSRFNFYAIKTIAVTIFQYQPLAVH